MQKILYIDNDEILNSIFKYLDKTNRISVDFCSNYENGRELYNSNSYNIVIVDFILEYGTEILKYILSKNPYQNIITISSELCNDEVTWDPSGEKNYNIIRLLKPVETDELIKSIKDFDSILQNHKNIDFSTKQGIVSALKYISKSFYGIKYDESTKIFSSKHINDFVDVIDFLDKNNIDYVVISDKEIQILNC